MSEQLVPGYAVAAEPPDLHKTDQETLDPQLQQARLRVQTIQRFQALNHEIQKIPHLREQAATRFELNALATQEYGNAWEVLKRPDVEVIPLVIGGKTKDELKQELTASGYHIYSSAEQMMDSPDFVTLPQPEPVVLIRLSVADLGFSDYATRAQIFGTKEQQFTDGIIKKFDLELCPAEVGPQYRLQTPNQPINEYFGVGMSPITAADGNPNVFYLVRDEIGRWLYYYPAKSDSRYRSGLRFLLRLPLIRPELTETTHE